jgi:drug/metabolite transporter (DMT)-like permease
MLTAFFWGGTFIAGRSVARDVDPFTAAFIRFCIATLLLLALTWKVEGSFPSLDFRQSVAMFFLGMTGVFAYNAFFFRGLRDVEAGRAAVIIASNPIFISLFSVLIFHDRLGVRKVPGILLSVTGAIVVITRGNLAGALGGSFGIGELFIFCCVFSWTAYTLIGKAVMGRLSPLVVVTYSSLVGTTLLLVPAYLEGMTAKASGYGLIDWIAMAYLGVFGTVLGFQWFYQGVSHIGPVKASQFINFVPISAVILAFLILGEPVTISLLAGAALVISGVYLTNAPARRAPIAFESHDTPTVD